MNITRAGVDIAKSVFHVHGMDRHDQVQWQGKYSREKWLEAFSRRGPARWTCPYQTVHRNPVKLMLRSAA